MDARMKARRALEFDLRQAVMCGEFELHYQPLVNIRDNRIVACEALLRWHHPTRGMISPAEFIPVAEETGVINPLGEWVLRTACAEAARWPDDITVTVNVSPVQFKSENLVQTVVSALAASRPAGAAAGARDHRVRAAAATTRRRCAMLHQLKKLGVRIAMDDFGTGYSSLNYLRRFPFDKIKIDRSFIKDIAEKDGSWSIVQAVVSIAKSRNIVTTAEGVETAGAAGSAARAGLHRDAGLSVQPAEACGGNRSSCFCRGGRGRRRWPRTPPPDQPRPTNGMPFAITVMNSTLVSSGRLAI